MRLAHVVLAALCCASALLAGCSTKEPASCLGGSTQCGATCVSLATDQANCGACGTVCGAKEICTAGTCTAVADCLAGSKVCGSTCVNVQQDQLNCGDCSHPCAATEVCSAGVCTATPDCLDGSKVCGGTCVNVQEDQLNCGDCDHPCGAKERCASGTCTAVPDCLDGSKICGGTCVNVQDDQLNCGDCNQPCGDKQRCVTGVCAAVPDCLEGSKLCGATCVNVQEDQQNCGDCNQPCGNGAYCSAGACVPADCPAGQQVCDSTCTNVQIDPAHCGNCDTVCDQGFACLGGSCSVPTPQWELLAPLPGTDNPSFSDFTPEGETAVYDITDTTMWRYDAPDAGVPDGGSFVPLADETVPSGYLGLARSGNALYTMSGTAIYAYDLAQDSWSTPVSEFASSFQSAETTADDQGYVYALSASNGQVDGGGEGVAVPQDPTQIQLVQYNPADGGTQFFNPLEGATTDEPRAAWDSQSAKVYLGDYDSSSGWFQSFDPATGEFANLASFPDRGGMSDAFCSDRKGHIFTANSDCSQSFALWVYYVEVDHWEPLFVEPPFPHGCEASCTVTADGWLYLGPGESNQFARLKLPPLPLPPPNED